MKVPKMNYVEIRRWMRRHEGVGEFVNPSNPKVAAAVWLVDLKQLTRREVVEFFNFARGRGLNLSPQECEKWGLVGR